MCDDVPPHPECFLQTSWAESPSQGLQHLPFDGPTSPVRLLAISESSHSASAIEDQPITRSQRKRSEPSSPQWPQPIYQPSPLRYHERGSPDPRISGGLNQGQTSFSPEHESQDESQYYRRKPKRRSRDPEKAGSGHSDDRDHYPDDRSYTHHTTIRREGDGTEDGVEEHSVWILVRACPKTFKEINTNAAITQIYLTTISPFLALILSVYTFVTTMTMILLSPFCFICNECRPFRNRLHFFLFPPISFQLGLIYSEIRVSGTPSDRSAMLILINICSPFYAICISASAWVAAGFWVFVALMGNPDGQDGKDDGREAVMGVRRWWERWLERAIR